MPDDQNPTQNQDSTENSIPPSPQEPTEQAPEITPVSEPSDMPSEAPEAPRNSESAIPLNNANGAENEPEPIRPELENLPENQGSRNSQAETAQTPVNEPLEEPETSQSEQAKPVRENSKPSLARELLISARNAIQLRKRKKLDRVMSLFLKHSKITNDEVEKFLHVSDATATRYLSELEKEGKIKQNGKTGHMVSYSRV